MKPESKTCKGCLSVLPLTDFQLNSSHTDGRGSKCKACKNALQKIRYAKACPDERRLNAMLSYNAEKRSQQQKRRLSDPIKREERNRKHREMYRANTEKYSTRSKTRRAVKLGILIKPDRCSVCGVTTRIEAHHDDYSNYLDVKWLCSRCHRTTHYGSLHIRIQALDTLTKEQTS
jgi:hypothetical protein